MLIICTLYYICTFSASFVSSKSRFCLRAGTALALFQTSTHMFPGIVIRWLNWPATIETTMETTVETTMETTIETTMETTMKTTMKTTIRGICWRAFSRLAWLLYKCMVLWRAVYTPSATEGSLGTICKEKGIFPVSRFLSCYCWKQHNTNILSFLCLSQEGEAFFTV